MPHTSSSRADIETPGPLLAALRLRSRLHTAAALLCASSLTVACSESSRAVPTGPGALGDADSPVTSPAAARSVIRVPADFPTIQAAVNAAAPGDKIDVAAGVYCEQVLITKSDLRLHSQPGGPAIITGECLGKLGAGIHVMEAAQVEITGFIVEHFEFGIMVMSSTGSRIHQNEARFNRTVVRAGVPAGSRGVGIVLARSSHNTVSQNDLRENGRNGILLNASSSNIVRTNRLKDNNQENLPGSPCNLMMNGNSRDNTVAENEITGANGVGIMIGPGIASGNRVAQNRIHGFPGPGVIAIASAAGNYIEQNDVRGNGRSFAAPQDVDLFDQTQPTDNTWLRNLGRCGPGIDC